MPWIPAALAALIAADAPVTTAPRHRLSCPPFPSSCSPMICHCILRQTNIFPQRIITRCTTHDVATISPKAPAHAALQSRGPCRREAGIAAARAKGDVIGSSGGDARMQRCIAETRRTPVPKIDLEDMVLARFAHCSVQGWSSCIHAKEGRVLFDLVKKRADIHES